MTKAEIENIEARLLIEAVFQRYGLDFRHYSSASLIRRIKNHLAKTKYTRISQLIPQVLVDRDTFESLARNISIGVTEMFRDPSVYKSIREHVVPFLKTYPFIKVWHAGCSTGEEAYAMAILLKEEGLHERAQIYATDYNDDALARAKEGVYSIDLIKGYTVNYQKSGGKSSFSEYYHSKYDSAIMAPELRKIITFANHNLASDSVFAEMNLIMCRNVLIYFDKDLQSRTLKMFDDSLSPCGFLCLGAKESLRFSDVAGRFDEIAGRDRIYRKKAARHEMSWNPK